MLHFPDSKEGEGKTTRAQYEGENNLDQKWIMRLRKKRWTSQQTQKDTFSRSQEFLTTYESKTKNCHPTADVWLPF